MGPIGTGGAIYLDYQATTPVDPRVLAAMLPYFLEDFGNPHSVQHSYGSKAHDAVEEARGQVASLVGAAPNEVVFTSGATEANNLALRGLAPELRRTGRTHIIVSSIEHKCVLEVARYLERQGYDVTYAPVGSDGLIDPTVMASLLRPDTGLVSVMGVNNEIGVIQPLGEIGQLCRSRGVIFHSDGAQAAGKTPLDVRSMQIDLLSLSAHKLYGPKGIGALVVRSRPRIRLEPIILGGGQESGLRSGTAPTPLCAGFGLACKIAQDEMSVEWTRLTELRSNFLEALDVAGVEYTINGHPTHRIPGNLNLSFKHVDAEALLTRLRNQVSISSGSACTAEQLEPSHVLAALNMSAETAETSVRVGFGRGTTFSDVTEASHRIIAAVLSLARLSRSIPLQNLV